MSMQDIVSDFVARVNNAKMAQKEQVTLIKSKQIVALCKKLTTLGYFKDFEEADREVTATVSGKLNKIKRVSKPGQRIYGSYTDLPRVTDGFGTNIVSTSKGLMTDKECKESKIGGEFMMQVTHLTPKFVNQPKEKENKEAVKA